MFQIQGSPVFLLHTAGSFLIIVPHSDNNTRTN